MSYWKIFLKSGAVIDGEAADVCELLSGIRMSEVDFYVNC